MRSVLIVVFLMPSFLEAQSARSPAPVATTENVVIVSGTGEVMMSPDLVSITLGVSTKGSVVRGIVDENNQKIAAMVAALKEKGVASERIRTSRFTLAPVVDRDRMRKGYEVSNTIEISSSELVDVGALVDAAIDSGANEIRGPRFTVENQKGVQDRCIERAFADARGKAVKIAALSQRRLGQVLAATDGSTSPYQLQRQQPTGAVGGVVGGVVMEPGVQPVRCGLTVMFALE